MHFVTAMSEEVISFALCAKIFDEYKSIVNEKGWERILGNAQNAMKLVNLNKMKSISIADDASQNCHEISETKKNKSTGIFTSSLNRVQGALLSIKKIISVAKEIKSQLKQLVEVNKILR